MTPSTSSPAASARTPPAAHRHCKSIYPAPKFLQTYSDSAPGPASPEAGNRAPALPPDSPHTATRTAAPPPPESRGSPTQSSVPPCAPPATAEPPPPPPPAPAVPLAPPAASPETHSPAPAHAADYFETSPRSNARRRSASSVPALRPASSSRVGPQ